MYLLRMNMQITLSRGLGSVKHPVPDMYMYIHFGHQMRINSTSSLFPRSIFTRSDRTPISRYLFFFGTGVHEVSPLDNGIPLCFVPGLLAPFVP